MRHCLWCHHHISLEIHWENLILPRTHGRLCKECSTQLIAIPQACCDLCHRASDLKICHDCERWKDFYGGNDPLIRNISLYTYNDLLQEIITKWKYRGDFVLGEVFKDTFKETYKRSLLPILPKDVIIIPIPLSEERLSERAFNQAREISMYLPGEKEDNLVRKNSEKQSKKSRRQRMSTINPFILRKSIHKTVVLVDDIYTTGRTLRHAAELLVENGCPEVYAYTLARG